MFDCQHYLSGDFDALGPMLCEWRRAWPGMGLLALLPEAEKDRIADLQALAIAEGVPLVGAVFPSLLTERGFDTQGMWLLRFNVMPPWFLLADIETDLAVAARRIEGEVLRGRAAMAEGGEQPTLFLVFDGMVPNIASLLNAIEARLHGRTRYAGVNAGSETFRPMPCLFDQSRVLGHGVLGLLLPGRTRVTVRHGYPVSRGEYRATSTEGNRIDLINGRPAFEVYRELIKTEYGVELTHENFYDLGVHFPFGVIAALDVLVRIPVGYSDDGALFCVGEVPAYSMLRLLRAPSLDESSCVAELTTALSAARVGGLPLLTFYCAGRRMHFGDAATDELVQLREQVAGAGACGALSLGEIDTMPEFGLPRFHNACVVCVQAE